MTKPTTWRHTKIAIETGLLPKTALATLAATALLLPFGAPLPGSCLRAIGVAGAAPSPSCGGDLRECLRQSADLRQTTFGGRYVTADDVAKCMEAFDSCISGGASRGGNTSPPESPAGSGNTTKGLLPQRFTITENWGGQYDCRLTGESVNCTTTYQKSAPNAYTSQGTVTGTLTGSTMTGTWDTQSRSEAQGCIADGQESGPVTFDFDPNGTVAIRVGPRQWAHTYSGVCADVPPDSGPGDIAEVAGKWSSRE